MTRIWHGFPQHHICAVSMSQSIFWSRNEKLYQDKATITYTAIREQNIFSAIAGCFVLLPLIIKCFKLSEPIILILVLYTESLSMCVSAFVPELWQFYLTYCVLGMMNFCKYSLTMSMISKVKKREMII